MEVINQLLEEALSAVRIGLLEEAEQAYAQAVKISVEAHGEDDLVTARLLLHLASVLHRQGSQDQNKLELAAGMYERLRKIHQNAPRPMSTDHVTLLTELSCIKRKLGMLEEADSLQAEADKMLAVCAEQMKAAEQDKGSAGDYSSENCNSSESDEEVPEDDDGDDDDDDDEEEEEEEEGKEFTPNEQERR